MPALPFRLVSDVINNSYARSRRAWEGKDVGQYQAIARRQAERGADYLDVNLDGTQILRVRPEEMLAFLPDLVPALQEATPLPLVFDNPNVEYHRAGLKAYDRKKGGAPILNSVAASRERLPEMLDLVREHDTLVIVMASEKFVESGSKPCASAADVHETARRWAGVLRDKAGRRNDQMIIDPGLAPVGADTYGLVNIGLDAMRLIRRDPDLAGVHLSVGLTNFSFGTPGHVKTALENAYITLATAAGLDFALANAEKDLRILLPGDPVLEGVEEALRLGRPEDGETQEDAGFRQAERIMGLF